MLLKWLDDSHVVPPLGLKVFRCTPGRKMHPALRKPFSYQLRSPRAKRVGWAMS